MYEINCSFGINISLLTKKTFITPFAIGWRPSYLIQLLFLLLFPFYLFFILFLFSLYFFFLSSSLLPLFFTFLFFSLLLFLLLLLLLFSRLHSWLVESASPPPLPFGLWSSCWPSLHELSRLPSFCHPFDQHVRTTPVRPLTRRCLF